jgi:tetratricopeptide (TPR) repeat protein
MADYAVSHALHIIEEAIFFYEQVLQLRPLGHERRHEATSDLGEALFFLCASHKADDARAHQSIELLREAVQLRPLNHPLRDRSLHNLARALFAIEYEQRSGDVNALTECIRLNHEVLQLRVIGHPKRVQSLGNLATALMTSFKRSGDPALLMECVRMDREAMQLLEPGHPLRTISLMNLANTLGELASFRGELEALAEADSLFREVLELRPPGHPLRFRVLDNLADSLLKRYELQALPAVLSEAIALQREAWGSFSADHPEWGKLMMNLAESLVAHFRHERDLSSITEAIALLRQSLLLLPSGHAYRHYSMDSLAEALLAQFEEYKDPTYLREAIAWNREVLELRPPGHTERPKSLQRLGRLLCKPEARHWPEALTLFHEAMESYPARHPSRSSLLSDISQCFLSPESPFFDLSKGISYLSEGYSDELSHVNQRLRHSVSDLRQVEAAYIEAMRNETVSVGDRYSSRILGLYVQIISLLPRAANFGLDHKTRLQVIAGSDEIARNATARALLLGRTSQAVELMEEGRGIFWSQTLHLRSTRFDCVPDSDREHFVRLLRMLEHGARTAESPDQTAVHREEALERRRRLNEELEVLITRIRTYPGSARFLMPASFASLLSGLPDGFVVVINASKLACHALLLHGATWLASNFELTPPSTGQGWMSLRSRLPRDIGAKPEQHDQMHRAMRLVSGQDTSLNTVFAQVWTSLVHPVICRLGLQVSHVTAAL